MRSFVRTFFLLVLVFTPVWTLAQDGQTPDSLLRAYRKQTDDSLKANTLHLLFNAVLYNDVEKAKTYAAEQLQLSKKIDYQKGIAQSLYDIGVYYNNINQIDSSRIYYQKALTIYTEIGLLSAQAKVIHGLAILEYSSGAYEKALELLDSAIYIYSAKFPDSLNLSDEYNAKGWIHLRKGNYNIALTEVMKAVKILEKLNDPIRLADAYNNLAAIELSLENFEQSIDYNLQAVRIYREHNDKFYEAQALNDIGNVYLYLGDFISAKEYLKKSIPLSEEMGSMDLLATALTNLGKTYTTLKQYDLAVEHLRRSLAIVEKNQNRLKITETLNALGQAYNDMNQPAKAIAYFDRAINLADSIGSKQSLRDAYFNRSASYAMLGQYKLALEDHQKYTVVTDSIFNNNKSRQIEELRATYDIEKKEQEIILQKKEIDLLAQKAKLDNLQKTMLGVGLAFLLAVFGFGSYGLNQKMKRNKLEKEKVDADLEFKKKELITHTLHLAKKNETLENLKQKAVLLKGAENGSQGYMQLIRTINADLQDDKNWENFVRYFEEVHQNFNTTVARKHPDITPNELRLMALIKMNLSTKEIASILNISVPGVKKARQRLRKKMNLLPQESLEGAILNI